MAESYLCNPLLVPPGENDDTTMDNDGPVLAANLRLSPGKVNKVLFCIPWNIKLLLLFSLLATSFGHIPFHYTNDFALIFIHQRIRKHLRAIIQVGYFSLIEKHSKWRSISECLSHRVGSLLRELTTHFSSFAVHNRKNLFVYAGDPNDYYMKFREDIHHPNALALGDDSSTSDTTSSFHEPPSPQVNQSLNSSFNSSSKLRQRHDSVKKWHSFLVRIYCDRSLLFIRLGQFLYSCNTLWTAICW